MKYKYDNSKPLGRGGNGTVYKAQDDYGNIYAIKFLHRNSYTALPRFKMEFDALKNISHENIIKVIDGNMSPEDGSEPFYVMEYMEGGTLRKKINDLKKVNQVFHQKDAISIMRPVIRALDYAHSNNILHRDLKPENILFDRNGVVKVADWGISRFLNMASMRLTMGGQMGTPTYCSPEQWEDSHNVDGRTDIFSAGVIFYELLTGKESNWRNVWSQKPPQCSSINSTVCAGLDELVHDMMHPDKNNRKSSLMAIRVILKRIAENPS